jgi:dihydrofolate reductase
MLISIVVAIDESNGIGRGGDLLWRLPRDMQQFKSITQHHHVLMGRKTYLSIPEKFRPLPDRENIILSRAETQIDPAATQFKSIEEAIGFAKQNGEKELMIIGGGELYKQSLDLVDRIYLTRVHASFEADTFFPTIDMKHWTVEERVFYKADEKNEYDMSFITLERIKGGDNLK